MSLSGRFLKNIVKTPIHVHFADSENTNTCTFRGYVKYNVDYLVQHLEDPVYNSKLIKYNELDQLEEIECELWDNIVREVCEPIWHMFPILNGAIDDSYGRIVNIRDEDYFQSVHI